MRAQTLTTYLHVGNTIISNDELAVARIKQDRRSEGSCSYRPAQLPAWAAAALRGGQAARAAWRGLGFSTLLWVRPPGLIRRAAAAISIRPVAERALREFCWWQVPSVWRTKDLEV